MIRTHWLVRRLVRTGTWWLTLPLVAAPLAALTPAMAAAPAAPSWQLDQSFGGDGTVVTYFQDDRQHRTWGMDVAVQPDGKIVVAADAHRYGPPGPSPTWMGAARYLPNGDLDESFGDGGIVEVRFSGQVDTTALELQQIGRQTKVVLVGHAYLRERPRHRMAIVRLNADGSLDSRADSDPSRHLGRDGRKTVSFPGDQAFGRDVVIQPNGGVVVAGVVDVTYNRSVPALVRLLPRSGRLDPSFGDGGRRTFDVGGGLDAVAFQPGTGGGKILIAGYSYARDGLKWLAARLDVDGDLDPTFGDGSGMTSFWMNTPSCDWHYEGANSLAMTDEGSAVVVGDGCSYDDDGIRTHIPAVARLRADGSLDPAFSDDGRAFPLPDVPSGATDLAGSDLALGAGGRVYWAGWVSYATGGPQARMLVGGLLEDGALDTAFGLDGYQRIDVGPGADEAEGITLDGKGRLVLAGLANDSGFGVHDGVALARLEPPPS